MAQWLATVIVGAVSLVGNLLATAYFYGRLSQRVENLGNEFTVHEREQREEERNQWGHIVDLRSDVGKLKGHAGINGS